MSTPPSSPAARTGPPADDELVTRLRVAVGRLGRRLRQEAIAADAVTPSQISALVSIDQSGPLTLGELAERERVRPPTITRVVANLEEAGLVARIPDRDDRRCVRVDLTPEGRRFLGRSRSRREAFLRERVATLDADQQAGLADVVATLEHLLDDQP